MSGIGENLLLIAIVFGVFLIAFIGLAIGVIISNRRLQGSCGGLANMKDEQGNAMCMACEKPSEDCRRRIEEAAANGELASASGD